MKGPVNNVSAELVSVHSPNSKVSEAYRGLRTSIMFSSTDNKPSVIMMTSAGPNEGKTLTCSNLATTLALSYQPILLIDGDMRKPRIHEVIQSSRKKGLSSVLVGKDTLADAIVETSEKGLHVLPVGPIPPDPSELIGSKAMEKLIAGLKKKFAFIIIDTPPVMAVTDAVALSPFVDGVILITRAGSTPRQVIKHSLDQLRAVNANILGVVLTGVGTGKDSYYYSQYSSSY
jgi:capsular exopolysaccharide synthesis family protein